MTRQRNDEADRKTAVVIRLGRRRGLLGLGWGWVSAAGTLAAVVTALAIWGGVQRFGGAAGDSDLPTAEVVRASLKVIVSADGSARSDKTEDIKSRIEGMTRILEIVPESARVKEGDFLVRLDTSDLERRQATQEIGVKRSKASRDLAEQQLEIQRALNASEVTQAELAHKFAEIDLEKYQLGDWPQQLQEAESLITIASEELERARDRLQWSEKLSQRGYISSSELAADELAVKRSELDVKLAEKKLEVLKKYTNPKELARRQSDLTEAKAELARTKKRTAANETKALTDLETKQEAYQLEKEQLDKVNEQLAAGTIRAPQPGLVVYASTGQRRRREEIDVGYQAREGETIIRLPDLNVMVADVSVPEAKRSAVEEGQPAIITVDAQPNAFLTGKVKSCGVLPVAQSWWRGGDIQQFQVIVVIDDPPPWLLPGLRCTAQILVRELDDVLQVPIQSVFLREETHFCYVREAGGRIRAVPVWVGLDDDKMVEIKAGLQAGWGVLLAEPDDAAKIRLEAATFRKPTPVAPPEMRANSQPADEPVPEGPGATTAPDSAGGLDPETTRLIERIRRRDPGLADRLTKMSPAERRKAIEQMRSNRPSGRDRPSGGGRTEQGG